MDIWYGTAKTILKTYLTLFSRGCHVRGLERLPKGPKIIAGNHPNATDGFFLPFLCREKLSFLAQENLFSVPFIGMMLKKSGQIPIWHGTGREAIQKAGEALNQGRGVVIFPEGTLNPGNLPIPGGTGAVRLSLATGVPIVPVGFYVPMCQTHEIIK